MALTFEELKRYGEIDQALDKLAEEEQKLKSEKAYLDEKIIDAAEWESRYKFEIAEIGKFEVKPHHMFSVLKQDKPALVEIWKADDELKAFVSEQVNAMRFKSECKKRFESDFKVPFAEYVRMHSELLVDFKPVVKRKRKPKKEAEASEEE